jgi:hypothetical protein
MRNGADPNPPASPDDPVFEVTDGGWDPYVASLLSGEARKGTVPADDDEARVMTLSRERQRSRR